MHIKSIMTASLHTMKPTLLITSLIAAAATASADLITFDPSFANFNYSFVGTHVVVSMSVSDFDIDRPTRFPANGETSAVVANASSFSTYRFTEAGASGSWTGAITDPHSGFTASQTIFGFIPTVDLRWEIEGSYENFPTTSGIGASFTSRIATDGGNTFIFDKQVTSHPFYPPVPDPYTFSFSGTLLAGESYIFVQDAFVE
jgi:hypothetical protein